MKHLHAKVKTYHALAKDLRRFARGDLSRIPQLPNLGHRDLTELSSSQLRERVGHWLDDNEKLIRQLKEAQKDDYVQDLEGLIRKAKAIVSALEQDLRGRHRIKQAHRKGSRRR